MGLFNKKPNKITIRKELSDTLNSGVLNEEETRLYESKKLDLELDFYRLSLEETTTRSQTRRIICLSIVFVYLIFGIFSLISFASGNQELAKFILEMMCGSIGTGFISTIFFYLGNHVVNSVVDKTGKKNI